MNLAVANHDGRLMNLALDTTGLKVRINMLVDGVGLVPVENGQAKRDKIVYFADQDIPMTAVVDASIDMLGVHTDISHIASTVNYHPYGDGVRIEPAMNTLPTVKVQGRALGIIPTGFIDTILPTRLDDIILNSCQSPLKGMKAKASLPASRLKTPQLGRYQSDCERGYRSARQFVGAHRCCHSQSTVDAFRGSRASFTRTDARVERRLTRI